MKKRNSSTKTQANDWRSRDRGKEYEPFLTVRDVPSDGLSSRLGPGWKTGRIHHVLSRLEERFFYTLEWSVEVIDIREQFYLPLEATVAIAQELGLVHPLKNQEPMVMTSDFVISIRSGDRIVEQVRTIKRSEDLASERTLEKLEIERRYWQVQKIDWKIVTEMEIPKTVVKNIMWLYGYRDLKVHPGLTEKAVERIEQALALGISDRELPLSVITGDCDDRLGQPPGTSLTVVRHLLATRRWSTDMQIAIEPSKPVLFISHTATPKETYGTIHQLANQVA